MDILGVIGIVGIISNMGIVDINYSYITVGVGYLCYYTSPKQSQGQVVLTKIPQLL